MPVYIHLANLVISKSFIITDYKGGIEAFRKLYFWKDCNNQEDNELFSIAAMNPDELPIQELKENGLEDVFAANNYEIVFKYGACSIVDWLIVESPFMWHKDCAADQIEKALYVQTITMDKIVEESKKGNYLLKTIK